MGDEEGATTRQQGCAPCDRALAQGEGRRRAVPADAPHGPASDSGEPAPEPKRAKLEGAAASHADETPLPADGEGRGASLSGGEEHMTTDGKGGERREPSSQEDEKGSECSQYYDSDGSSGYASSSDGCVEGVCDACGCDGKVFIEPGETLDAEWWDARFRSDIEDGIVSEWVVDYEGIVPFMLPHLNPSLRTLVVGCGNSDFSARLCTDAGFLELVNTDISPVVIDHMREKHAKNPAMTWVVDDSCDMTFGPSSFDQIVDKSLLDCMCHCEDPDFEDCVGEFVCECFRVLRPGGVAIFVTKLAQAELRNFLACDGHLEDRWCDLAWTISRQEVYAPKNDRKMKFSSRVVPDKAALPDDCDEYDTILVFKALKWQEADSDDVIALQKCADIERGEPGPCRTGRSDQIRFH